MLGVSNLFYGANRFDERRGVRAGILRKMRRIPNSGLVQVGERDLISHLPPEIFDGYDAKKLDMWVMAVVLFELLTGEMLYKIPSPYDLSFQYFVWAGGLTNSPPPDAKHLLRQPILRDVSLLEVNHVHKMTPELKELFENTLCVEASRRWGVEQVLECEWFKTKFIV